MTTFLFKINNTLYNWPSHIIILTVWLFALSQGFATGWIKIGLYVYVGLMLIQLIRKGLTPGISKLAYLVGLNISVVFGPLTPFLAIFLAIVKSKDNSHKE